MERQRRTFLRGKLEKDLDVRLIPDGAMIDANNILVANSEGSDVGAVENVKGNEKLTNLGLTNATTIGKHADTFYEKIYYINTSDYRDQIVEYDKSTKVTTIVLESSRPGVLNFDKRYLITGIVKVHTGDPKKDLLIFTDDLNGIRCVNIERAKTYGLDGFEEDDISLIKKPPRYAPKIRLTYTSSSLENYIEDRFLMFAYRYKYLDGEYSALSTFSNVAFEPRNFNLDYQTFENEGMVNSFNAVKIGFNTGSKRVIGIDLVFKESNNDNIYIIQRFLKSEEGWGNDEEKDFLFANNKVYTVLPSDELNRLFDNVPRKAKALTLVGNILSIGNYLEGYDLKNIYGEDVIIDYNLKLNTREFSGEEVNTSLIEGVNSSGKLVIDLSNISLNEGSKLNFVISVKEKTYNNGSFKDGFEFILNTNYASASELSQDEEFITFIETIITGGFNQGYEAEAPDDSEIDSQEGFTIESYTQDTITIKAPSIVYKIDQTPGDQNDDVFTYETSYWDFSTDAIVEFSEISVDSSLKSNRSYEVVLIYMDEYGRSTTGLESKYNTLYIPQDNSTKQSRIRVQVNHLPPDWADRYKFAIKQNKFEYETIYATVFYTEGLYRWVKLEGANKNKVQEGDTLIVKSDLNGPISEIIKCRVIEVSSKEKDFIEANTNEGGGEIIEQEGLYMKIKPSGFDMNQSDSAIITYDDQSNAGKNRQEKFQQQAIEKAFFNDAAKVQQWKIDTENIELKKPALCIVNFNNYDENGVFSSAMPINAGSKIDLYFRVYEYKTGTLGEYDKSFIAASSYPNIKEWFEAEVGDLGSSEDRFDIHFEEVNGEVRLLVQGNNTGSPGSRRQSRLHVKINVLLVEGMVIFETEAKEINTNIFFETSQIFDITDGFHQGNIVSQNAGRPAEVELDVFNCYVQGNGVESYKIKDAFNARYLNIDTRPTSVSIEKYKEIRRSAEFTYGGAYVESTNINRLNEFNLSTGNFYDRLEKIYGSIQMIVTRDTDIIVWQEDKVHRIPFRKDILFGADGAENVKETDDIFGRPIPYHGEYGISRNPESLSWIDNEFCWIDAKRQVALRLLNNGIFPISNYGMVDFFYDFLRSNINTKKVSVFDPFNRNFVISLDNDPSFILPDEISCSDVLNLNGLKGVYQIWIDFGTFQGTCGINYNVKDIPVKFRLEWGNLYYDSGFRGDSMYNGDLGALGYPPVSGNGVGSLYFDKNKVTPTKALLTITSPLDGAEFSITGVCPNPTELTVVSVIVNDEDDAGKTITNRYKWLNTGYSSPFKNFVKAFEEDEITLFESENGKNGQGYIPADGSTIYLQAYQGYAQDGEFLNIEQNRLGYLVTDILYNEAQIENLLNDANYLSTLQVVETTGEVLTKSNFVMNRANDEKYLYLIWDYTSKNKPPVAVDDFIFVESGQAKTVDLRSNDTDPDGDTLSVIIVTQPQYGDVIINGDGSITYTHDGSNNFNDSFKYKVTDGVVESNVANVTIDIGLSCEGGVNASGNVGIYELEMSVGTDLGETGINYNAFGVPDRFEIYYDDVKVADSKYVGNSLTGSPPGYPGLLGEKTLSVFKYNGSSFDATGEQRTVNVTQNDIADGSSQFPTAGVGSLLFDKTTNTPTKIKIVITGPVGGTAWNISGICPI